MLSNLIKKIDKNHLIIEQLELFPFQINLKNLMKNKIKSFVDI